MQNQEKPGLIKSVLDFMLDHFKAISQIRCIVVVQESILEGIQEWGATELSDYQAGEVFSKITEVEVLCIFGSGEIVN